jgi:hypothetical protein
METRKQINQKQEEQAPVAERTKGALSEVELKLHKETVQEAYSTNKKF